MPKDEKPQIPAGWIGGSDISRIGYTDEGRVYSIICPQQGVESPSLGNINVEVTVTGQRGWVEENTLELACDMSVAGRVWFGPGHHEKPAVKLLWKLLDDFNRLLLDILNMSGGNMLKAGNVLTWNLWFNHPELVDQEEWREHAEKARSLHLWPRTVDKK